MAKEKVLKGFGVDVRAGDYVGYTFHDSGYYGTKGPLSVKERGILKVKSFQLRGEPRMLCENSKGNEVSFYYRSTAYIAEDKPSWYREFRKASARQIRQFEKTRAKHAKK